jgi:hypothetical protein
MNSIRHKGQKYEILAEHAHVTAKGTYTTLIELWSECPTCADGFSCLVTRSTTRNRRESPVGGTRCVAAAARIRGARKAARARRRGSALESLL